MSLTRRPGCPFKMGGERNSKNSSGHMENKRKKESEEELVNVRRTFGSDLFLRQPQLLVRFLMWHWH